MSTMAAAMERFAKHAMLDGTRETCGLIVQTAGGPEFVPCENRHANPDRAFRIDRDLLEQHGAAVLAVCHSHVGADARPSEADRAQQKAMGIPWLIVAADTGVTVWLQ